MKNSRHGKLHAGLMDHPVRRKANPVRVQDLTLRDGHQSLFATRCRTGDFLGIAGEMDEVGFHSLEVWGGATFDTMHRFLAEDPWERIRTLKQHIRKTPFSMLLRGQNLVGYRNYPDDVAEAFVEKACENGIDIFRVFDALNDFRNFKTVVRVIKKNNRHFQGAICYSLTGERMGGGVYSLKYYLEKARVLEDMGADTICIKDMAGLLAPYDAFALVTALKDTVSVPIHLHSHFTSGMADLSLLKAIEAGVDIVDTCLAPWAYRTSHPAVEPLVAALKYTDRDTGLDLKQLARCGEHFEKIAGKYRHLLDGRISIIDINVLLHQTPGGMISNLISQLREMDALDRLDEVFAQIPVVRKELGQVPLVTPTSQIVGIQTVNNVLFDQADERYTMITSQVKDLCYGLYGQTPVPVDEHVSRKALKGYARGESPVTGRPADVLEPEMEKIGEEVCDLAQSREDVLTCALFPTTGKRFLRWKYGLEEVPDEIGPAHGSGGEKKIAAKPVMPADPGGKAPQREEVPGGNGYCTFHVHINDEFFRVDIEQVAGAGLFPWAGPCREAWKDAPAPHGSGRPPEPSGAAFRPASLRRKDAVEHNVPEVAPAPAGGTSIVAPMPGTIIRIEALEGSEVNEGDVVLILEAMKMENFIVSPVAGTVREILFEPGQSVRKNDVLAVVT